MKDLTTSLSPQEEIDLENALKRLLTLQGKYISKNDFSIFLDELSKSGRPIKAIVAGLDSLRDSEHRHLTLRLMLDAIDEKFEPVSISSKEKASCDICLGHGVVEMQDQDAHKYALACKCPNGDEHERNGRFRWNGLDSQAFKYKTLYLREIYKK